MFILVKIVLFVFALAVYTFAFLAKPAPLGA